MTNLLWVGFGIYRENNTSRRREIHHFIDSVHGINDSLGPKHVV